MSNMRYFKAQEIALEHAINKILNDEASWEIDVVVVDLELNDL